MALYDYRCEAGHAREVRHGIDEAPELTCDTYVNSVKQCGMPMQKYFASVPPIAWKCAGATKGYRGGGNIPNTEQTVPNPGHRPPTVGQLGLSHDRQVELGLA
jgi:predicted nucleic acid-binding Zn ribbon protein